MKRPLIWASFGMLLGFLCMSGNRYWIVLVALTFLCCIILFIFHKSLGIILFCGILFGVISSFCYQTKAKQVRRNLSDSFYMKGVVRDTYSYGFSLRLTEYGNDEVTYSARNLYSFYLLIYTKNIPETGAVTLVEGSAEDFPFAENPGQFDSRKYYTSIGCIASIQTDAVSIIHKPNFIHSILNGIRSRIYKQIDLIYPKATKGICTALLLGDKSIMDYDQRSLYENFGLAHILAISGLHIGIFSSVILQILLYFLNRNHAENVVVILVIGYGILCGFSISCVRAVFTFILSIGARRISRNECRLSSNLFLMDLILFLQPYRLHNLSFQLSFAAGILLSVSIKKPDSKQGRLQHILRTSLILQIGLLPIQLRAFFTFSPICIVFNMILLAFLELAFILLIISVICSLPCLYIGKFFGGFVHYSFSFLQSLLKFAKENGRLTVTLGYPSTLKICLFLVLYVMILLYEHQKNKRAYLLFLMLWLVFLPIRKSAMVCNLSVGQGDCSVILDGKHAILIDCGSMSKKDVGEKILKPFLQYYGYDHVDYVFLSHLDEDHINGIYEGDGIFDKRTQCYVDTYYRKESLKLSALFKEQNVHFTNPGDVMKIRDITIRFYGKNAGDDAETNEHCQVLSVFRSGYSFLFLGDVSSQVLSDVAPFMKDEVYLIKVPHHGSRNSLNEAFYESVKPDVAVVSVGRNSYGHPNEEVLEILHKTAGVVYVTKEDGAVITELRNRKIRTYPYRKRQ